MLRAPVPIEVALSPDSPQAYLNRELSWLSFARRVLAMVEDTEVPLLERLKFAGIVGTLHDEFFMKRMSGIKRLLSRGDTSLSLDGLRPVEELMLCREEVLHQEELLGSLIRKQLLPSLAKVGIEILKLDQLNAEERATVDQYFRTQIQPILTPLAVDAEHPFPFVSSLGLNLLVQLRDSKRDRGRLVRIKVPGNRPRWIPLPGRTAVVPVEQAIAANLRTIFPDAAKLGVYQFRVTRAADNKYDDDSDDRLSEMPLSPGSLIAFVSEELKARRFAGIVRLQVGSGMPEKLLEWLTSQLALSSEDVYVSDEPLAISDLMQLSFPDFTELHFPHHEPAIPARIAKLPLTPGAIFSEIAQGDILLHHPYQSFDQSVVRFLRSAAADPATLAIKLTIYRTNKDSPIIQALLEAARAGKQVAVLVEITARFDEQPNIEWAKLLEKEGAHVAYGVERLKTHVKLALVIREEADGLKRYVHVSTGNYHSGTARVYEDLGVLSGRPDLCEDVSQVFNELTGATPYENYSTLLLAPRFMRLRFRELIEREVAHAKAGRASGIYAKMNQLQDTELIAQLYRASQDAVPVLLNIRGLNCLRPGVPGLSDNIRVFSVVGRFLEHSRVYRFENDGKPDYYLGSADWMRRNLDRRVETLMKVNDKAIQAQLDQLRELYEADNCSAWDCGPDGTYTRRTPGKKEPRRAVQDVLIAEAAAG
jgi:polyphosphate kinase